jgi:cytochrome c
MSTSRSRVAAVSLALIMAGGPAGAAAAQHRFPGVGRPATPAEIAAWDIDVRPDFVGLPKGAGSVARGQDVWEERCASCHGVFGESNQVFPPIVGGTTKEDMRAGRTAALRQPAEQRTTLMKLPTVATLWDYINRAMPWDNPKTLATDDVYALVAYVLHLGEIVPADFVLSDANIREVQARLPNRQGMIRFPGLWDVKGTPDVRATACMKDCTSEARVISELPTTARNSHGNLVEQHRLIGPVRGADTSRPAPPGVAGEAGRALASATARTVAAPAGADGGLALANKHACVACHAVDQKLVGPSFKEIAARYRDAADAATTLVTKMRAGGAGTWGPVAMPPQAHIVERDLQSIARWIVAEVQ